jgi:hypothetical protein
MKIWIERFRKLPTPLMFLHVFSKVLLGFGLGLMLGNVWEVAGLPIIIIALALSIYPAYKIISGK